MTDQKLEIYRAAAELLKEAGYVVKVRDDYSGRAMYGKTTPAIVTDASGTQVGAAIAYAAATQVPCHREFDDLREILPGRSDSMGLSTVWY